ncbi:tail fiber assembly protein [Escherichia coli]|nr:tail fiber assembly protein [Escherichia coli]MCW7301471.1 tail fiber assembly protein [Escherichia coli]
MDTLKEIAAAINNDPKFSTTINNALEGKQPLDNTLTNLSGKDVPSLLTYLGLGEFLAARVAGKNGLPTWALIPPPSHEELIQQAESERQLLLNQANEYMNSKQWPGKAAIGRLKGEELAQYNSWLDYLDALELVDTTGAPDIEWPTPPAVQAR